MAKGSKRKVKEVDESIDSESETQNGSLTTLLDPQSKKARKVVPDSDLCFVGPPISAGEARRRWPLRYQSNNKVKKQTVTETSNDEEKEVLQARNHYAEAMVDGCLYKLGDNAYVKVPDYTMKFVKGRSTKPFDRLWMDEIVNTVVTRAEPHKQNVVHPSQDRVLTIRENARLQGFPDCYKLFGTTKERYIQVGNAVAVPVAIALGYAFGLACQGLSDDEPLMTLPLKFPNCLARSSQMGDDSD